MMQDHDARGWWIVSLLAIAVGASAFWVARAEPQWFRSGSRFSQMPSLDLRSLTQIDSRLIAYEEKQTLPLPVADPRGIAVADDGRIVVVGNGELVILSEAGVELKRSRLENSPVCVAVAGATHAHPNRIYVGGAGRIEVCNDEGSPIASWRQLGANVLVTSIAIGNEDIYAADAANRVVLCCDSEGHVRHRIGEPNAIRETSQFIVPSPHFDVAVGPDDLLYVSNPGARRIEAYSRDGTLESFWGTAGSGIEAFFGCCNPAHVAVLADGNFVTSEKGVPRIKVYESGGTFQAVVAGPDQLRVTLGELAPNDVQGAGIAFDVAVDRRDRILVLDSRVPSLRVFTRRDSAEKGES